jgi:hypothetical protein
VRAWPHKNNTGWFFVAKIVKTSSLPEKKQKVFKNNPQWFEKLSNTAEKTVREFLSDTFSLSLPGKFYTYRSEIYYGEKNIDFFWENFFLFKTGIKIGKIDGWVFEPNFFLGTNFGAFTKNTLSSNPQDIHLLLKWEEIPQQLDDGYYQIIHNTVPSGIVKIKNGSMKSLLESRFMRK